MKYDLLFFSDPHLKEYPVGTRSDDSVSSQIEKMDFIQKVQKENNCPCVCAGDLFDEWDISFEYYNRICKHLPEQLIVIPGQHDLPRHSLKYLSKTALYALYKRKSVSLFCNEWYCDEIMGIGVYGSAWGQDIIPPPPPLKHLKRKILVVHKMIWSKKKPYPSAPDAGNAEAFLEQHRKKFDLIISGDNHKPFLIQEGNCTLLNCGSVTRMKANEVHLPTLYGYTVEDNRIYPIHIPCVFDPFGADKREEEKEKEQVIMDFINKLKETKRNTIDFRTNVKTFLKENNMKRDIKKIICEVCGI